MIQCNIQPRDNFEPVLDGKLHRFPVEGDRGRETSGRYIIHADGWPNWLAMDYRQHNEMQKFKLSQSAVNESNSYRKPTREEIQRRNEQKRQEALRQEENHRKAILMAWKEFSRPYSLMSNGKHPYLIAKNVTNSQSCDIQLRVKSRLIGNNDVCRINDLLIPLTDSRTGNFISMIHISEKPQSHGKFLKPFFTGTHTTGACVELIPQGLREWYCFEPRIYPDSTDSREVINPTINADTVYVCEGIATGFSVLEITQHQFPVLCACSCHNIINVAKAWKESYPDKRIIIAADNDNSGISAAQKTINEGYAQSMTVPPVVGMDWNDYLTSKRGIRHE